jgi:23S rRNA pseudouridine1911/1915/1917 synthase
MSETETRTITVAIEQAGQRLDHALAELFPEFSRTRIKDWIDGGRVLVDGLVVKPRMRVLGGETVRVSVLIEPEIGVEPEAIDLNIVYADEHVFVINKPAGLVVHPGAGNAAGTLQNALLHRDPGLANVPRAGIVHRIDKDTSGLLVIARTIEAHTSLVKQIEAREMDRAYEAVCVGVMTSGGTVDAPIGRHNTDRIRMTIRSDGRDAVTHYRVIARFRAHTHVRVQLETGRTHQIRVHLAHVHYPLIGDAVYGGRLVLPKGAGPELVAALRAFKRQALHAGRLEFAHPVTQKPVVCEVPVPADMRQLIELLAKDAKQETG